MGLSKAVVKNRVLILMIALILLVPAVFGMLGTRINYDMLDYLPGDMDTVIGQETLKEDFGKGAFSFIVVQDMPVQEVAQLKEKIQQVDHVESVLWYDSVADLSIPMELLPDKLYNEFNTDDATMLAVFFDSATSEDVTMDAIREIRSIAGKQCFVSGMSALVTDLKDLCEQEEPIYVALAVACACAAMMLLLDGWLVPFVFLASIGMAIVYNLGSNFFLGEISYITKALSAVLQLAVTMDYSIFLWHSYNEQLTLQSDHKEAMAVAIHNTFTSVIGSSATTIAGFIVGAPVLRLQGDYLAIVTLAFGEIIKELVTCLIVGHDENGLHILFNLTGNKTVEDLGLSDTGIAIIKGAQGTASVKTIASFTAGFILVMVTLFIVLNLKHSRAGRAIMALRDNRIATSSIGINTTKYKLMAFVTSAALAGAAGALYGLNYSSLQAAKFNFNTSILVLVFVVLGGLGNIWGSLVAAAALTILPEALREFADYRMLVYAIVLILVMLATHNPTLQSFFARLKPGKKEEKEAA